MRLNIVDAFSEEDEIVLAPPTTLIEEAKEIAQDTNSDEKFAFALQYDPSERNHLLSMLNTVGAIVEKDDTDKNILAIKANMKQLSFIKRLNYVERVKSDKASNPFLTKSEAKRAWLSEATANTYAANKTQAMLRTQAVPFVAESTDPTANITATLNSENDSIAIARVDASANARCPSNANIANAETVSDESYTFGAIECPEGEQWFKFTATKTGQYTILTMSYVDTIGTLYDCYGNEIAEVDDHYPSGDLDFRITQNLTAGHTYYVKVRIYGDDTGSYTLRITDRVYANYVTISPKTIALKQGELYELPLSPNYVYKGYNGAKRIPGLSVSIDPANASEQKVDWWEERGDVLDCFFGWDDDGDRYIHVRALTPGSEKLYARDWNENGKSDTCTVTVATPYCGGDNYKDVRKHSMVLQSDGYYVCSKCGYRIKSPALQDKDILSQNDYLKMIAVMHYYAHNVLLAREHPISAYFYNAEAEKCKIVMDTIRSQNQYSSAYEYQGSDNKYLANETNDTMVSLVSKSTINALTIGAYNGFYETIASLVIGYYCPIMGTLIDIVGWANDIATGKMDAISFGSFIAELVGLDDIAIALSFFSSASDIIDCDVVIGDPVVRISFSAYAYAEYVFDTNFNIKKVSINYPA